MSWAEYRIRRFAYEREQKSDWYKVREIAWNALIGSHVNPKKLPKSKEKFIPLDSGKKATSSELVKRQLEAMRNAVEVYKQQKAK